MLGFWFLFHKEDEEYLTNIIKKLSQKYDSEKFIPHITAHGITNLQIENIDKKISKFMKNYASFIVKKNEILYSDNFWKTLYIDISENKNLLNINQKLKNEIPIAEEYHFLPHISLMYKNLDKNEKERITEKMKLKNEFKISRLSIQRFSKKIREWKSVKEYSFEYN